MRTGDLRGCTRQKRVHDLYSVGAPSCRGAQAQARLSHPAGRQSPKGLPFSQGTGTLKEGNCFYHEKPGEGKVARHRACSGWR